MSQRESTTRYVTIIRKLRKGSATFEEINEALRQASELQGDDLTVSLRTFQRILGNIRVLFGMDIKYNYTNHKYFIETEMADPLAERMLEAYETINAMWLFNEVSPYLDLGNKNIKGTEHLGNLISAVRTRKKVCFTYMKFNNPDSGIRTVDPYGIKEFKNRFYLVGCDEKDEQIKSFALDRMSSVVKTERRFTYPEGFTITGYFRDCFGIIKPDNEDPERIVLSFQPEQGNYIKTLPLHRSQEILIDSPKELRVALHIYPAYDFLIELMSYGDMVKVIEPERLKKDLRIIYQKALRRYRK